MAEDFCTPAHCRDRERHCRERLDDSRKLFLQQMESMDKSVDLAKREMERRLTGMNEFRAQLEKQADNFLGKDYYDIQHRMLTEKIDSLMAWKNMQDGKASWTNLLAVMAVIVSVIFGLLHFYAGVR